MRVADFDSFIRYLKFLLDKIKFPLATNFTWFKEVQPMQKWVARRRIEDVVILNAHDKYFWLSS